MKRTLMFVMLAVAMCTAASAGTQYTNTTGGTVYVLDAPTSWAVIGGFPETVTLTGAGPDGADAYYRVGAYNGTDDSTQAYWDFSFANLPNVGHDLASGLYAAQGYVSDYGALSHEGNAVVGTRNGSWGWNAMGAFSSWNGIDQAAPGWTNWSDWGTGTSGMAWLSKTGDALDMTISCKWNPWGGYGGLAISGMRISTDGNFAVPEPSSLLALLAGIPGLAIIRRRK